jgi:hypothetical protein
MKQHFRECQKQLKNDEDKDAVEFLAEAMTCIFLCLGAMDSPNPISIGLCLVCVVALVALSPKQISHIAHWIRRADEEEQKFKDCLHEATDECSGKEGDPHQGNGGGGGAETGSEGEGSGGDPYGFDALDDFLDWLYSIDVGDED